ncbi:hypothetical protein SEMRO_454_G146281.1 [Seminavis robusta]|uniref:Uncharacterized protein n=1 Tax=Seminavis robusta TaxID=568900 RepID=A0A9N8E258_9STRA|nr:hypothetical protein SEMRO_454_G146281.1 [Seminavis robusta]|eukprot:Sro454_g146281.1  (112) ;mRNA; f:9416-9751
MKISANSWKEIYELGGLGPGVCYRFKAYSWGTVAYRYGWSLGKNRALCEVRPSPEAFQDSCVNDCTPLHVSPEQRNCRRARIGYFGIGSTWPLSNRYPAAMRARGCFRSGG